MKSTDSMQFFKYFNDFSLRNEKSILKFTRDLKGLTTPNSLENREYLVTLYKLILKLQ